MKKKYLQPNLLQVQCFDDCIVTSGYWTDEFGDYGNVDPYDIMGGGKL